MRVIGMRRLIDDNNVVHAHHDGALWTDRTYVTACGILFTGYDIPNEGAESSLRLRFKIVTESLRGTKSLRGTVEDLEVSCMSCLVRTRTWDRT